MDPKSPPSLRGVKLLFKTGRLSKRTIVAGVLHAGQEVPSESMASPKHHLAWLAPDRAHIDAYPKDLVEEERLELSQVAFYRRSRLPRPFLRFSSLMIGRNQLHVNLHGT